MQITEESVEDFRAWLAFHEPTEEVGTCKNSFECPLAQWSGNTIHVDSYTEPNGENRLGVMPRWAYRFVGELDDWAGKAYTGDGPVPVTAAKALEILDRVG